MTSITKEDHDLIIQIADRVLRENKSYPDKKQTLIMDLTACHANECPLDLAGLLAASQFDLIHDVYGIYTHFNRETGKLEGCFVPRYALANQVPVSNLPGGIVVSGGTPEQHDILRARGEFVARYCKVKGWDVNNVTIDQLLEIRSQNEWKNPGGTNDQ